MAESHPIIAVTLGDAAGVGPELCLHLLKPGTDLRGAIPLILGSAGVLARAAERLGINFNAPVVSALPDSLSKPTVFDMPGVLDANAVELGKNQAICGRAAGRYIEEAVRGCLEKRFAAMVTAPISKKALNMGGINYPGHTEMLADLTRTQRYAMLLYSEQIACAFVTCHQSLRSVSDDVTLERGLEVSELAVKNVGALKQNWGRHSCLPGQAGMPAPPHPRLCLLGVNPHAGEEGLFGDEELRVLKPALESLRARGIDVEGPLPSDTAFSEQARSRYDCYISMYHDQGAIPFKMLAFDTGVNITMGLPIIRTSPDHGTAFDIAWQGKVRPDSFLYAYEMAVRLALSQEPRAKSPRA